MEHEGFNPGAGGEETPVFCPDEEVIKAPAIYSPAEFPWKAERTVGERTDGWETSN